jgi:DNA invertase Pin-like site-specific DNA recombinase
MARSAGLLWPTNHLLQPFRPVAKGRSMGSDHGLRLRRRGVRTRGASLKETEQPIDTSTATGKCFPDMLGVFAEFETNLRRERQLEGIAKAMAAGCLPGAEAID